MIQRYDPDSWMDQLIEDESIFNQSIPRNRLSKNQLLHLLAHRRQPRLLDPRYPFPGAELSETARRLRALRVSPPDRKGRRSLPGWMRLQ